MKFYEFYSTMFADSKLGEGWFSNDQEAEQYAETHWEAECALGIEIRCYDGEIEQRGAGKG